MMDDKLKFDFEIDGVLLKYRADDEDLLRFSIQNKSYSSKGDEVPLTMRQFNALRKMLDVSATIIEEDNEVDALKEGK